MIKTCILAFVSLSLFHWSRSSQRADDALANKSKRDVLYSLLKDPEDEEHDELSSQSDETHAHEWTIQLHKGGEEEAKELADAYGFEVISKVEVGDSVFRLLNPRGLYNGGDEDDQSEKSGEHSSHQKRESLLQELGKRLEADKRILWYKRERILTREKRVGLAVDFEASDAPNREVTLSDPKFPSQWYIRNTGQTSGPVKFDSNIVGVWNKGFTGKGIHVSILDDGIDHTHPDLKDNYDQESSTDLNGHDRDPFPNDTDPYNAHGTKCCGAVAAKGNNTICGIGIAYNAGIGAIRMLDGKVTDGLEANSLSFNRNHIDIYSCSWGPKDNGKTFGRPGRLGRIALAKGVKYGRKGLGSLFVWASGNGGMHSDDCNCDGYAHSIYTIAIGAVNEYGKSSYFGERCSSKFAVTYTGTSSPVITTYLHHQCASHFAGTSAASPLAAGIFALALEANPKLTWRDMQHLVFHTAKVTSPGDQDWKKNGCGKHYNHMFGFGVLDAFQLVNLALNWTRVPEQRTCKFRLSFKRGDIPSGHHFRLNFTTNACQSCTDDRRMKSDGKCKNAVEKLEHVAVNVTLKHRRRGDLSISLISPSGTVSRLLHRRPRDRSDKGLKGWSFVTVFNWCENPSGTWQVVFDDKMQQYKDANVNEPNNNRLLENTDAHDEQESIMANVKLESREQNFKRGSEAGELNNAASEARDTSGKSDGYMKSTSSNEWWEGKDAFDDFFDFRRKRREAVKTLDRNKRYATKTSINSDDIEYKDPVLKRGALAGTVQSIYVTFYGTA